MKQLTYSVIVLLTLSSINQTFSAIFFNLHPKFATENYFHSKSASVYRGLPLSYSPTQKNRVCQDIFSAQLYVIPELTNPRPKISITSWINDGQTTEGEPHHSLTVKKFEKTDEDETFPDLREIFFECVGDGFSHRQPVMTNKYIVYNAYRRGWWLGNIANDENQVDLEQGFRISLSPEYVQMEQEKLEQQYLNIRKTIEALQKESSEYVQFMEKRDALSSLSVFRKLFLCASILSSPIYRVDRLEFSMEWFKRNSNELGLRYETRELTFTETVSEKMAFMGFRCEGFVDGNVEGSDSTSLFITPAYDDKNSVYVVEHKNDYFVLSKYFRYVPLLINVDEPLDEGYLYLNY